MHCPNYRPPARAEEKPGVRNQLDARDVFAPACTAEVRHMSRNIEARGRHFFWRYGYAWITAGFFLLSLTGHWLFGWFAFVNEQRQHNQPAEVSQYVVEMARDTLENWQSEFLQLIWQVGGLALLLYVGSPQSREGDDRKEAKLDELLRLVGRDEGDKIIAKLDRQFHRTA
jgi:hypothetical protein